MNQNNRNRTQPDAATGRSRPPAIRTQPDTGSIERALSECDAMPVACNFAIGQASGCDSAEPTTTPTDFDAWIERTGADGRRGLDRPGQPVATRWWEHTAFDDLPSWDILGEATL